MKSTRILTTILCGAAAFSLCGCGGGGGSSAGTGNSLTSGRADLVGLASGAQPTTTQSLQTALANFQAAVKADPTNTQARFGEAVALSGVLTALLDGGVASPGTSGSGSGSATSGTSSAGGGTLQPPPPPTSKVAHASVTTRDALGTVSVGPAIIVPAPPTTGVLPPAPPNIKTTPPAVPPASTLGLFWFLDRGLSNPYTLLQTLGPVTDLHLGFMAFNGYSSDASDIARRQQILANTATVLADLQVVEADPTFTYTLPAPDQNGNTVTIGLPEVYLFDAYINSIRTQVALSLAYIRDPGNWQPVSPVIPANAGGATGSGSLPPAPPVFNGPSLTTSLLVPFSYASLDTNHDGKLEPNEYLPPSPYLTLRDATLLTTAQQSLAATAAKETLGITGVLARPTTGSFLVPNTAQIAAILNNIQTNVVPLIAQAATGPVTLTFPHYLVPSLAGAIAEGSDSAGGLFQYIPSAATTVDTPPPPPVTGGTGGIITEPIIPPVTITQEQVTVDLAAWFTNPPQDLKVFAPTYTLTSSGWIDPTATVYPDLTFGGLFPNGLPQDLRL